MRHRGVALLFELKATGSKTAGPLSFTVHGDKKSFWQVADDSDVLILSAFFDKKRERYKKLSEGWNHWLVPLVEHLRGYDSRQARKGIHKLLEQK